MVQKTAALAEKLKLLEKADLVSEELSKIEISLDSLSEEIVLLQQKLSEAKTRQKSLVVRHKTADSKLKIRKSTNRNRIEDTISKLDQYERRLDELEGKVESYDIGQQSLAEEIEQLNKDEDIDNELEIIKQRLNKSKEVASKSVDNEQI